MKDTEGQKKSLIVCHFIYLPRFLSVSPGKLALTSEKKISCSADLWLWMGMERSALVDSSAGQECCGEAEKNMSWCVKQRCEHLQMRSGISGSNEDNKDHREFSRCL